MDFSQWTPADTADIRRQELPHVRAQAQALMDAHGLADWTLRFDNAKRRAGMCDRAGKVISLSFPLMSVWTEAQRADTILHEIAHALTSGGHNAEWRQMCRTIGADPARTWGQKDEEELDAKWTGTCPAGHVITRERLTRKGRLGSCSRCSTRYDARYLISWQQNY